MSSPKAAFVVLLMIGVLCAFNPAEYAYKSETPGDINSTDFAFNGSQYSIISFSGSPTFLLKDGEPLQSQADISAVLKAYYVKAYYPSEDEIAELRSLITKFNSSRNNGYDFKNKEEYVCRDDVLLSNGKISIFGQPARCTDEKSCEKVAMLLFSVYGEGLGLGSPSAIVGPLKEFTPSSLAIDSILNNYTYMLDTLSESTVYDTMGYIKGTTDELKNYSYKIESTVFRTPRLNDTADRKACSMKCWAICPSMDLDQAVLDQIKAEATELQAKVAPIGSYNDVSTSLYTNTIARFEYKETESEAADLNMAFNKVNKSGFAVITLADSTLKHASNSTLSVKNARLKALHTSIPSMIAARNFTNVENDIAEYKSLVVLVNSSATELLGVYESTKNTKSSANALIFVLDTKDLDPVSASEFESIKNDTESLDSSFKEGLSYADLVSMNSSYAIIESQAQALLQSEQDVPASQAVLLFRGFARRVNSGIASVATDTEAIDAQKIPENPIMTLGTFSALVFLSFASLIMIAFLYLVASTRKDTSKTRHVLSTAFVVAIIYLLGLSVFLYLFLGKTSTDATFSEYKVDLDSRNSTSIVLDMRNVSYSDSILMQSCAYKLSDTLGKMNKSWAIYALSAGNCNVTTSGGGSIKSAVDECIALSANSSSTFQLGYSPVNEQPKFSIIYQNKAQINANSDYYESCPLVALFS